jgi:hypothetical protein
MLPYVVRTMRQQLYQYGSAMWPAASTLLPYTPVDTAQLRPCGQDSRLGSRKSQYGSTVADPHCGLKAARVCRPISPLLDLTLHRTPAHPWFRSPGGGTSVL